jgi:hypothetical protein
VPQGEQHLHTAVKRIDVECAGEVLVYMDERENPLRYALHTGVEAAMLQARVEYGVAEDEWEPVTDRLPWKKRRLRRTRRKRRW